MGGTEKLAKPQKSKARYWRQDVPAYSLLQPASLKQQNSLPGLGGKQLLSLRRLLQCRPVINVWIIFQPTNNKSLQSKCQEYRKQTDVESICPGNISNKLHKVMVSVVTVYLQIENIACTSHNGTILCCLPQKLIQPPVSSNFKCSS